MAVRYAPNKLRVPAGFQTILEGLAREVLREQPHDIINFAADYFKHQVELKQESNMGKLFSKQESQSLERSEEEAVQGRSNSYTRKNSEDQYIDVANTTHPAGSTTNTSNREEAATKIQAGFRGHKARERVNDLKQSRSKENTDAPKTEARHSESYNEEAAATKIQAGFRGHKARERVNHLKQSRSKENADAPRTEPRHSESYNEEAEAAATKIQAGFRGHKARGRVNDLKKSKSAQYRDRRDADKTELYRYNEETAATKIQAGFRGHKTRKEMKHRRQELGNQQQPPSDEEEWHRLDKERAATKIQAGYKGYQTRKQMKLRKNEIEEDSRAVNQQESEAATKIQAQFRGHQARKELRTTKHQGGSETQLSDKTNSEQDMEKAATKIQAGFRGHKVRQDMKNKDNNKDMDFKTNKIQDDKSLTNENMDDDHEEMTRAATKIQAGFRGHKARQQVEASKTATNISNSGNDGHREQQSDEEKDIRQHRSVAATKIQANYRGYSARKHLKSKRSPAEGMSTSETDIENNADKTNNRVYDAREDRAATKIQAGFRGHRARREVNNMKR